MSEEKKNLELAYDESPFKLSEDELAAINGGNDGMGRYYDPNTYYVYVKTSYLALRTYPDYKYENEIGKMWNGYTFTVYPEVARRNGYYVYGYCPQLNMEGWTNGRFLYRNNYRDPYLD